MFLMSIVENEKQYVEVTPSQQERITALIRADKLPPKFNLGDSVIITATIIGFTEKHIVERPESQAKITSWDELRVHVRQAQWYQRAKKKSAAQSLAAKPPTQAVPLDLASVFQTEQSQLLPLT